MHVGRGRLGLTFLASSSLAALMIGGGMPAAYAACPNPANNHTGNLTTITNSGAVTCISVSNAFVGGFIANSGTISPLGISVANTTMLGGITDGGPSATIAGGIAVDSRTTITGVIAIGTVPTFGGGISTAGVIATTTDAISVKNASTFSGGIINSGSITAGTRGILVTGPVVAATFLGGITNSGTISVANGIAIEVTNQSVFSGGITNSGALSASGTGILVQNVNLSTFSGGVTSTGTISAGVDGIAAGGAIAGPIMSFSGGVSTAGLISAKKNRGVGCPHEHVHRRGG